MPDVRCRAYASMRGEHPEFQGYINCPATHAWVVDSYDPKIAEQFAALVSVCEQCYVAESSSNAQLAQKCRSVMSVA